MRAHIRHAGTHRLELHLAHDGEHTKLMEIVGAVLCRHMADAEHPRGGRFILAAQDPLSAQYGSALAIIDTWHDAHGHVLMRRVHRLLHVAAQKAGATLDSPEPPTEPDAKV